MKTTISTVIVFLHILLFVVAGCGNKTNKTKALVADIDSVKMILVQLEDSTSKTWEVMIGEDDQKIAYLKRLIDEVSYTRIYDQSAYDSLSTAIESLKTMRYDQRSMSDSKKIDLYDSATAGVVNKVIIFAQGHPNFEDYPIMEELINGILAADSRVIYRRVDYDNIAMEYNQFIDSYGGMIRESGNAVSAKPLFQLSE